jgi:hypothetical protein
MGYPSTRGIEVSFGWVENSERISNQDYYYVYSKSQISLNRLDSFAQISAYIGESDAGDYIELYGKYKDGIIENYITNLNNSPDNDYIILHDLTLYEQIPSGGTSSYIQTQSLQLAQTDEYDKPIKYRPIIVNSSTAISYKIEYVVRLFNRVDSSQIWKTASFISSNVSKYGRSLTKLNLGDNPIQTNIYNQIVSKTVNLIENVSDLKPINGDKKYANYVTSFIEKTNINISATSVYSGQKDIMVSDNVEIFPQGLGKISLSPFDSFIKFVVYQESKNVNSSTNLSFIDLNGVGDLLLLFETNSGERVEVKELADGSYSKAKGEVIFKVPSNIARQVLGYTNKNFYISAKNDNNVESMIYSGSFLNNTDFKKMVEENTIKSLQDQVKLLNDEIKKLQTSEFNYDKITTEQQRVIDDLGSANESLNLVLDSQIKVNQDTLNTLTKQKAKYTGKTDPTDVKNTDFSIIEIKDKIDKLKNSVKIPTKKGYKDNRKDLTKDQKERETNIKLSANIKTTAQSPYTDALNI